MWKNLSVKGFSQKVINIKKTSEELGLKYEGNEPTVPDVVGRMTVDMIPNSVLRMFHVWLLAGVDTIRMHNVRGVSDNNLDPHLLKEIIGNRLTSYKINDGAPLGPIEGTWTNATPKRANVMMHDLFPSLAKYANNSCVLSVVPGAVIHITAELVKQKDSDDYFMIQNNERHVVKNSYHMFAYQLDITKTKSVKDPTITYHEKVDPSEYDVTGLFRSGEIILTYPGSQNKDMVTVEELYNRFRQDVVSFYTLILDNFNKYYSFNDVGIINIDHTLADFYLKILQCYVSHVKGNSVCVKRVNAADKSSKGLYHIEKLEREPCEKFTRESVKYIINYMS